MTKPELKEKQIEIYNAEQKLADLTYSVLFELINAMTDTERQLLVGNELDGNKEIVGIDSTGVNYEDTEVGDFCFCELEELSQIQQKEIIDAVIYSIWKM